jgi:hypothetical protein
VDYRFNFAETILHLQKLSEDKLCRTYSDLRSDGAFTWLASYPTQKAFKTYLKVSPCPLSAHNKGMELHALSGIDVEGFEPLRPPEWLSQRDLEAAKRALSTVTTKAHLDKFLVESLSMTKGILAGHATSETRLCGDLVLFSRMYGLWLRQTYDKLQGQIASRMKEFIRSCGIAIEGDDHAGEDDGCKFIARPVAKSFKRMWEIMEADFLPAALSFLQSPEGAGSVEPFLMGPGIPSATDRGACDRYQRLQPHTPTRFRHEAPDAGTGDANMEARQGPPLQNQEHLSPVGVESAGRVPRP